MITDQQVRRLRRLERQGIAKEVAAARVGMDAKTAGKYRRLGKLPSEVLSMDRNWRTHPDLFAEFWSELEEKLLLNPGLEAKTLFADLQRRFPGRFADGQLRTLQRRVKIWRAESGPAKEVFFAQVHRPGRLAASDFTHCTDLGVTQGQLQLSLCSGKDFEQERFAPAAAAAFHGGAVLARMLFEQGQREAV